MVHLFYYIAIWRLKLAKIRMENELIDDLADRKENKSSRKSLFRNQGHDLMSTMKTTIKLLVLILATALRGALALAEDAGLIFSADFDALDVSPQLAAGRNSSKLPRHQDDE